MTNISSHRITTSLRWERFFGKKFFCRLKNCKLNRKMKRKYFIVFTFLIALTACIEKRGEYIHTQKDWKEEFNERLPLLGHRNWILIVDKAYPEQTTAGVETINTNEDLLSVLKYVKSGIDSSKHINAEVFTDKELGFITPKEVPTIVAIRDSLKAILGNNASSIPHDSVFVKIESASKLFKILVLKTNQTIPYTSVFMRLNCAYWDGKREKELRDSIESHSKDK